MSCMVEMDGAAPGVEKLSNYMIIMGFLLILSRAISKDIFFILCYRISVLKRRKLKVVPPAHGCAPRYAGDKKLESELRQHSYSFERAGQWFR